MVRIEHALICLLTAGLSWPCVAAAQEMPAEYKAVLSSLGKTGDFKDGVLKVNIPRTDLQVSIQQRPVPTALGFGGWVAFTKAPDGMGVMMGDLVLTEDEVNPVMSAVLDQGLQVTALHNHFFWEQPRICYMHVHGMGRTSIGNTAIMAEVGTAAIATDRADALRRNGETVMFVAVDGVYAGLVGVADRIKATTVEAIEALHGEGLRIVMLTGDSRVTAEAVARSVGIDNVEAEVLPEQKAAVVKRLQAEGRKVAMAGDGINDAPALAQAEVGIAMGTGTDVAMERAGVTLVQGDLRGLVRARRLSRATMRNIRQNLFFAIVYNALGVPVAAGVLYPAFGLLLSPIIASAAMTFSSVLVIGNALRLRRQAL